MPVRSNFPGVYVEEISSGVRPIASVATSITAFVGRTARGIVGEPVAVLSSGDFTRDFGGPWADSPLTYAVEDFFTNGGSQALIVRLFNDDEGRGVANVTVGTLDLTAGSPGAWGNGLQATVSGPADRPAAKFLAQQLQDRGIPVELEDLFDMTVVDRGTKTEEIHRNLTVREAGGPHRIDRVLEADSRLVRHAVITDDNLERPADEAKGAGENGHDGAALAVTDYLGTPADQTGLHALEKAHIFNLLCIPPDTRDGDLDPRVWADAAEFCHDCRAFLIIDPVADWDADPARAAATVYASQQRDPILPLTHARNAALYFPRLIQRDRLQKGRKGKFVPCGAIAGIIARTDETRGVWKAPAGMEASIQGIESLTVELGNEDHGQLNTIAVNCLRRFTGRGLVVWGARTLRGSDQLGDEYKYVPVRRLALHIEESLYRGTQWVVFEPNDEPLWTQLSANVVGFMHQLFQQGAFQGTTPDEAYFVKCDSETTTLSDINNGILNFTVGFAPLKPAEFVVLRLQHRFSM